KEGFSMGLSLKAVPQSSSLLSTQEKWSTENCCSPNGAEGTSISKNPNSRGMERMLQETPSPALGLEEQTACSC
ncbi:hypothetical protein P7K49_024495, partial [Saguinus oedipus]